MKLLPLEIDFREKLSLAIVEIIELGKKKDCGIFEKKLKLKEN